MARRLQTLPGLVLAVVGVKHMEGLAHHVAQAWEQSGDTGDIRQGRFPRAKLTELDCLDRLDSLSVEVSGKFLMEQRWFPVLFCQGSSAGKVFKQVKQIQEESSQQFSRVMRTL